MKKFSILCALALCLMLGMTACGGDESSSNSSKSGTTSSPAGTTTEAATGETYGDGFSITAAAGWTYNESLKTFSSADSIATITVVIQDLGAAAGVMTLEQYADTMKAAFEAQADDGSFEGKLDTLAGYDCYVFSYTMTVASITSKASVYTLLEGTDYISITVGSAGDSYNADINAMLASFKLD